MYLHLAFLIMTGFYKPKNNQFVNVSKIHNYIGNSVTITLPSMFILTGCDIVNYF